MVFVGTRPKRGGGHTLSAGGPLLPEIDGMMEEEVKVAYCKWCHDRKQFKDQLGCQKRRADSSTALLMTNFEDHFVCVCSDCLYPMTKVAQFPLMDGHTSPNKEMLLMQIVDEASILGVQVGIKRSDQFQFIVKGLKGNQFDVGCNRDEKSGWQVLSCILMITSESSSETTITKPAPDPHLDLGLEERNANKIGVKD